jgi:hypothetical protein
MGLSHAFFIACRWCIQVRAGTYRGCLLDTLDCHVYLLTQPMAGLKCKACSIATRHIGGESVAQRCKEDKGASIPISPVSDQTV